MPDHDIGYTTVLLPGGKMSVGLTQRGSSLVVIPKAGIRGSRDHYWRAWECGRQVILDHGADSAILVVSGDLCEVDIWPYRTMPNSEALEVSHNALLACEVFAPVHVVPDEVQP